MKMYLLVATVLFCFKSFGQTSAEAELINLSAKVFALEVQDKIDSLETVFHKKFIVVSSDGSSQRKADYLQILRSGKFIHNNIEVEESTAIIAKNSATVTGKGKFAVTIQGNKISLRLSYIEVFTRDGPKKPWKVLAMKASVLDK
jgi:Domain of unknown function (DUF4440)